jgi:hypothetical protein
MGTEIENIKAAEDQALEAFKTAADTGSDDLVIPMLKIGQSNSAEVVNGDAQIGDFINSLTGDTYGTLVEFIVSSFEKGRFRANENNEVVCTGREPDGKCGCHGVLYEECEDSEEQYSAAVNRGEKEWGKGPPCATTWNFTGFIPGVEMPLRLSLKKTDVPQAKKLLTILKMGARAPWDLVFQIETRAKEKGTYKWQGVSIKQSRKSEPEEAQKAVTLAVLLQQREAHVVESVDPDASERPAKAEDGIDY